MNPDSPQQPMDITSESRARNDFVDARSRRTRSLGSLFGNIDYLVEYITIARAVGSVKIWLDARCDIVCSAETNADEVANGHLVASYASSSTTADIRSDLVALRELHSDRDVRFLPIRWFVDADGK